MRAPTILVFAKPPFVGLAKTRLAKSLGAPALARRIAFMTLAKTMRATRFSGYQTTLLTTPRAALQTSLGRLWPATLERYLQVPGDLTCKLEQGLECARPGPVLFIGADAPDLKPAHLRAAVNALRRNAAVFGPARDGGFWLFGLNKTTRTASPFRDVRWSSAFTLEDVRRNLPKSASIAYLPQLIDIDEAQDWHDWRDQLRR